MSQPIYVFNPLQINGVSFDAGDIIGHKDGKKLTPTKKAAEKGVTPGNLEPRLADGRCSLTNPLAEPTPDEDVPYADRTNKQLIAEVNERRKAGRNLEPESTKKADLIAALEADDEAHAGDDSPEY